MYFSADQVGVSFKRLASRKRADGKKTKTHLERTSALMCFLAFDVVCKNAGHDLLDLNPETAEGRNNRKSIELEFAKLVLLDRTPLNIRQVSELGKIDSAGKDPEKRLSSNFLTVPLKKATEQAGECFYPKRPPSTPVIQIGQAATGLKWGMKYHQDWRQSLPKLLSEVKDSTPFTDLGVFLMRDTLLTGTNYVVALSNAFKERFSAKLADFWIKCIEKERIMARHMLEDPFSMKHQAFAKPTHQSSSASLDCLTKNELISYVNYLEELLEANEMEYESPIDRRKT